MLRQRWLLPSKASQQLELLVASPCSLLTSCTDHGDYHCDDHGDYHGDDHGDDDNHEENNHLTFFSG